MLAKYISFEEDRIQPRFIPCHSILSALYFVYLVILRLYTSSRLLCLPMEALAMILWWKAVMDMERMILKHEDVVIVLGKDDEWKISKTISNHGNLDKCSSALHNIWVAVLDLTCLVWLLKCGNLHAILHSLSFQVLVYVVLWHWAGKID